MEVRIDELARLAGTSVRNVRAYQERGLLPPGRRQGRAVVYTDVHVARLRLIGQLLDRGFSLQNISELVVGWERGRDLGDLLGFEAVVASPFAIETPAHITADELLEVFGADEPSVLQEAAALGLVELEGDGRFFVPSPRLLHAGAELRRAGVPLAQLLDELKKLRRDVDRIASRFVGLVVSNVFGRYGADELPPADDLPELAAVVQRLRPLAEMVVDVELARALERHAQDELGERLSRVLEHVASRRAAG